VDGGDLSAACVEQFLAERRERHRHFVSPKGFGPLLSYLRGWASRPWRDRSSRGHQV
jgi:hypothetical protein